MKIIVSHDIDHFYWSDHFLKDFYVQKYIIKNTYYLIAGRIPFNLFAARMSAFSTNRISRLQEMTAFNKDHKIPASYFMGVRNALSLSYDHGTAKYLSDYLKAEGFPLYLHGMAFDDFPEMQNERNDFLAIAGDEGMLGMRMHYLRLHEDSTLRDLSRLGYAFDSTTYGLKDPYFIGKMIEFPVCMMEAYEVGYDATDLKEILRNSVAKIEQAQRLSLNYFTVIFHDNHFSEHFPIHLNWYKWLINYFHSNNFEFVDFKTAVGEISNK